MSVIIRLQNLPWSANAADIRQFFHGLSIPEGGVHIVGGQLGDAFIAFSTDEDARQGMASDGGILKDSRVKLYLSSRTEMQKIIEETRQQHMALQAVATGGPNMATTSSAAIQRPFVGGPFASTTALPPQNNASISGPSGPRPTMGTGISNFHLHMENTQGHLGGYDHQMYQQQQSHQLFSQSQSMMSGVGTNPAHGGGFAPHLIPSQTYSPHLSQGGPYGPRLGGAIGDEPPLGPYGVGQHVLHEPAVETNNLYDHGGPQRFGRDRRDSAGTPPEVVDRNRDGGRGGYRSRDRGRRDRQEREKDKGPDVGRRGRRSRSRSRSGSRGRGRDRDRRRRSRSDSRERAKNSRDRDRNGKLSKSGLLPTPADQMEKQTSHEQASDTSVQLRLLAGDLTYRDIRDYLSGINVPNTCIKMINALDGYRFGLAYIRFTSNEDKLKALARHNGMIRGYPVQIIHVKDSAFNQAIDSFSPGISLDAKSLSNSCLSLRDFPPVAAPHNVREAFGTISIGQVLPERNESGTVTGLCYVELSSEADARKAIQLLKDGVVICGRQVKVAFLPLEELHVCTKNLERLRGVVGPVSSALSQTEGPLSPGQSTPYHPQPSGRTGPGLMERSQSGGNGSYDPASNQRGRPYIGPQRVFISGLPLTAMERDIGDFFSDVGVIPQMVEIVYDEERMPTGNAYCQFASMKEAERALDKNGGFMGGHTVSVTLVESHDGPAAGRQPAEDMRRFSPYPEPPISQPDHGPRMYGHPGHNDAYHRPPMGSEGGNGFPPQMGPRFGGSRFAGPRYPPGGSNRGNFGGNAGPRPRPPVNMRMRMPVGMIHNGGGGSRGGSDDGSPTPGFGAPGCVVALSNVPHKALIADILDFFRGFQVNEKCVIRRFGPNGEPTGDARVAFPSPDEAEAAVRTLQNEYLLNRRVMLSIV
ncbi:RNA-binding protein 12 [Daphnia magna]|uniref:RRM domain-containing protein n=1 Tax=Daphnia magna TaxID=35525 RepID=A0ABQ9ZWZ2_9CRUS|nr:RNA-binding protein 12 [Daphnia magna]XP_045031296.1 RNA-binding protein 12 [Daphnia magna]KAK4017416.1 hypothetical protein OUZ56_032727 [Daphnia magna]